MWNSIEEPLKTRLAEQYLPVERFGQVETILSKFHLSGRLLEFSNEQFDNIQYLFCRQFDDAITYIRNTFQFNASIYCVVLESEIENAMAIRLPSNSYCVLFSLNFLALLGVYGAIWQNTEAVAATRAGSPIAKIRSDNYKTIDRLNNIPVPHNEYMGSSPFFGIAATFTAIFHELGHIINGHLGREHSEQVNAISETARHGSSDAAKRLVLEFDADAFATQHVIQFYGSKGASSGQQIATIILGCSVLYSFMSRSDDYDDEWLSKPTSHPPALHRLHGVFGTAYAVIQKISPETPSTTINEIVGAAIVPSINAATLINGRGKFSDVTDFENFHRIQGRYLSLMWQTWAELRPSLEKSKLGNHKLAPVIDPASIPFA